MATHSSTLENPIDRRAWQAIVYGVAKSWTQLSDKQFHTFHLGSYKTMCHQILSLSFPLTCIKHLPLLKTGDPTVYFIEIYLCICSHFPLQSLIIYTFACLKKKKKTTSLDMSQRSPFLPSEDLLYLSDFLGSCIFSFSSVPFGLFL